MAMPRKQRRALYAVSLLLALGAFLTLSVLERSPTPSVPEVEPTLSCTHDQFAAARLAAQGARVTLSVEKARVGEPLEIAFEVPGATSLKLPLVLMVEFPDGSRFRGAGFMPFTTGAPGPHGLTLSADRVTAAVPFSWAGAENSGTIGWVPAQAGETTLKWSLRLARDCDGILRQSALPMVQVQPGPPKLVLQDPFAAATPKARYVDSRRTTEIRDYATRFEVIDRLTGTKLLDMAGVDPAFSPSGRFVAARINDPTSKGPRYVVFDVRAHRTVWSGAAWEVAWTLNDSILVLGGNSFLPDTHLIMALGNEAGEEDRASLTAHSASKPDRTFIGSGVLAAINSGCTACSGWQNLHFRVDLNQGVLLHGGVGVGSSVTALLTGGSLELQALHPTIPVSTLLETARSLEGGWEGVQLTHVPNLDTQREKPYAKLMLPRQIEATSESKTTAQPTAPALVVGRGLAIDRLPAPAYASVAHLLSQFGLDLKPAIVTSYTTFTTNIQDASTIAVKGNPNLPSVVIQISPPG